MNRETLFQSEEKLRIYFLIHDLLLFLLLLLLSGSSAAASVTQQMTEMRLSSQEKLDDTEAGWYQKWTS